MQWEQNLSKFPANNQMNLVESLGRESLVNYVCFSKSSKHIKLYYFINLVFSGWQSSLFFLPILLVPTAFLFMLYPFHHTPLELDLFKRMKKKSIFVLESHMLYRTQKQTLHILAVVNNLKCKLFMICEYCDRLPDEATVVHLL